jgi:hypothetical protein
MSLLTAALFVWLISHQPTILFSQNKSTINNQSAVLFSQNKPAPAISHQPNEQVVRLGPSKCGGLYAFRVTSTPRGSGNEEYVTLLYVFYAKCLGVDPPQAGRTAHCKMSRGRSSSGWSHRAPGNALERQICRLNVCTADLRKDLYTRGRYRHLHARCFCARPLHSLSAGPTGTPPSPTSRAMPQKCPDLAVRRSSKAMLGRGAARPLDIYMREEGHDGGSGEAAITGEVSCLRSMRR